MTAALNKGKGILGSYQKCSTKTCNWMSRYPDSTSITDMSIPGTHDTATWDYTLLTQLKYHSVTGWIDPAPIYRCQSTSIFQQLNDGNRAFDLRVGFGPNGKDLIFFHSEAILDLDARLDDVMYGFYRFLDENPTETLLLSVKVENSTWGTPGLIQQRLYTVLTSSPANSYLDPGSSVTATPLSSFRGKIILLRRFALDLLPSSRQTLGLDLSSGWNDNDPDFTIATGQGATHIEDYYEIGGPFGANSHISLKTNATITHVEKASTKAEGEGLYISFASGEQDYQLIVPRIMASGNGLVKGVNGRLKEYLVSGKGKASKRKGIILTDWYADTPGLIDAIIG
ncbi:hypothetical protein IAR55_007175 [Kwoniella newhampshirensis]|uniref:Phosphatidylinositol-specific phospholipase C X domain-containing protein n=1 Tax=Kwoniella newhampshirensis TaxID=1651941 RepID=A0AAW0YTJ2_9TREE